MSTSTNHANDIDALIAAMAEDHGLTRLKARQALVAMNRDAVAPLAKALQHSDWRIRWGAAKALGQIGDPSAADALIESLEDERPGVRSGHCSYGVMPYSGSWSMTGSSWQRIASLIPTSRGC
jgi:HEAT repeat protein